MKINALLLSSCHVLLHLNLVQGAKAEVAHDFSRNSVAEKSARPKESSALQGLDQLMGAHCGVPCLPRTKMPASTKSLNGVKVLRRSWRKWSIWIAHKEKKRVFLVAHFKLLFALTVRARVPWLLSLMCFKIISTVKHISISAGAWYT